jgi:uncharacterized lipoprotein YmbA
MNVRRPLTWLAAGTCIAIAAGCSTSPPSRYYTLSVPATPARAVAEFAVAVGPVSVPAVVDRPEIVVTVGDNEVWPDEFNRWAGPLAEMIGLALVENLTAQLRTPRVALLAQTALDAPDYRVVVDVQRFESVPGSHVLVDAVYSVRRMKDGVVESGRATRRETAPDKSYDALAAAHSRAVAQLSRDIADAVRALNRPER